MFRAIKKFIFSQIFKIWGWKVEGKLPDLKKYLIVVAPHTSNWDFLIGYSYKHTIEGFNPNFLAKKELFNVPILGSFIKSAGGYPVVRSKKMGLVDQVAKIYKETEEFIMTVAPEGTRSHSPNWKTGFYRIAEKANIPIVKVGFDYGKMRMVIADPFFVSGNIEKEMEEIVAFFRQFTGKFPEKGVVGY